MPMMIDAHTHCFSNPIENWIDRVPSVIQTRLNSLRKNGKRLFAPAAQQLHKLQPILRFLPDSVRRGLEKTGGVALLPGLIFNALPEDLIESMNRSGIAYSLVMGGSPFASNDFVLDHAQRDRRLLPVVTLAHGTPRPGHQIKQWVKKGARAVKIHPVMYGGDLQSPTYRSILHTASDLGLPVYLHTGEIHLWPVYKYPERGDVSYYRPWFETYREVRFILSHMNFHFPHRALDLMEDFGHLHADTSWQPQEIIGEAVRRVGADRLLFGSDWPLGGENVTVCLSRIQECIRNESVSQEQADLILGKNAARLFALKESHGA